MPEYGFVTYPIAGDIMADDPVREMVMELAFRHAPGTARGLGGILVGPPRLIESCLPGGGARLVWGMVRHG